MAWPAGYQPIGPNRQPLLNGLSVLDGKTEIPVAVDPATGALIVEISSGGATLPATVVAGQKAVTGTAAALPSGALVNGVIVTGLSTNTISVFIGPAGVTTSTGAEIQSGAALSAAVSNLDGLYVVASTTGATVTWLGS